MIRRIFGLLLLIALALAPAIAQRVRDDLWASYRNYTSPYLAELPSGTARPALSPRVVCVLVRGLRLEESRNLPTLHALRKQGLDATVALAPPTYRLPSWMGFVSGATPDVHGITRNDASPNDIDTLDTIFKQLHTANKNAAVIASIQWSDWFGPDFARFEETVEPEANARDDAAINTAIQLLQDAQQPTQFVLIELVALDGLADADMGTQPISPTATTTDPLKELDARLYRLISTLDLATNTVMVMSDRGRDAQGKDGGDDADVSRVPWVVAGAGIKPGTQDIVKQSVIAPMLAALLGTPMPTHAQGAPLIQALDFSLVASAPAITDSLSTAPLITASLPTISLPPPAQLMLDSAQQRVTFDETWSEINGQPRFAAESLQRYRIGIESGNATAFEQLMTEIAAKREAAETATLTRQRLGRLPVAVGLVLALIALIGLCLQKHPLQPFVGMGVYYALWLAVFALVRGHRFSLSMFANGLPQPFWPGVARDCGLLLGGVCLFVALATARHKSVFDAIITVLSTLGLIICVPLGLLAWFYWQWGLTFVNVLPNSGLLAAVLIGLTHLAALNIEISPLLPTLPLAPMVALGAALVYFVVRRKPKPGLHYERVKIR